MGGGNFAGANRSNRMRILIIDDHAAFRQVVKMRLRAAGVDWVECEDGKNAVAQYPLVLPDLVLMDISMKEMDGLRATAQIKARDPGARIVILTEYDDPDLRQAAEQAGACDYLLKEDLSRLSELLRSLSFGTSTAMTSRSKS